MHRIKEKDMQSIQKKAPLANNHISVDCVVIGFDGEQLKVLLVKRAGEDNGEVYHDMKLPGSLIYMDEDLDEAAQRVLYELTGLRNVNLMQFKAFGSKNRTSNPKDVRWLERAMQSKVERIVTIAYLSMVKIDRALDKNLDDHQACWIALKDVMTLAFDHNLIIKEAMTYIRQFVEFNPSMLFELLPRKFTAAQLRTLFELVYDKPVAVRWRVRGTDCRVRRTGRHIQVACVQLDPVHDSCRHAGRAVRHHDAHQACRQGRLRQDRRSSRCRSKRARQHQQGRLQLPPGTGVD